MENAGKIISGTLISFEIDGRVYDGNAGIEPVQKERRTADRRSGCQDRRKTDRRGAHE